MMHFRTKRVVFTSILSLFLLSAGVLQASAQDVAAWFSKGTNSQTYGVVRSDLESLSAALMTAGLSDSLLAGRLAEAASKKVPAALLVDALRLDVARSIAMAKILAERGLMPADAKKASQLAEQALIFFRAGLIETDIAAILEESSVRLGPKAKPEAVVARSMIVMSVVADMQAVYGLSAADRLELERALASSTLADSKLNSVADKIAALVRKNSPLTEAIDEVVSGNRGSSGKPEKVDKPDTKPGNTGNQGNAGKKNGK